MKLCIPKDQLDKALSDLEAAKKRISELEIAIKNASTGNDCSKTRDSLNQALVDLESKKNAYDAVMAEYQDCQKSLKQMKADLKACEDKLATAGSNSSSTDMMALMDSKMLKLLKKLLFSPFCASTVNDVPKKKRGRKKKIRIIEQETPKEV